MELSKLIGKKIVAIKGCKERKNSKNIDANFILFDDKETVLELEKQDCYDNHDYSFSAREFRVFQNKEFYGNIMDMTSAFGDATISCAD